jgi:hypothetical protein
MFDGLMSESLETPDGPSANALCADWATLSNAARICSPTSFKIGFGSTSDFDGRRPAVSSGAMRPS